VNVNYSGSLIVNILYITKDVSRYQAAMYQNEFLQELKRQANVKVYGPGEKIFNPRLDINKVSLKLEFKPDWIIVGHAWLADREEGVIDDYPGLSLEKTSIPKAIVLNKEYVRIDEKLGWIKRNHFQIGFSHHHDVGYYSDMTGTVFYFLPFAFDANKVRSVPEQDKVYSLSFSGILQNQNKHAAQSDIRVRVMNEFFYTFFDIPIFKKARYSSFSICWNSIPRNWYYARLAILINKYAKMDDLDYYAFQKKSVLYFNSPSPIGIISPRLFENMACKTVPFCVESELYTKVLGDNSVIEFKSDLSDFYDKLVSCMNNKDDMRRMSEVNYKNAFRKHTWEIRVKEMIRLIECCA